MRKKPFFEERRCGSLTFAGIGFLVYTQEGRIAYMDETAFHLLGLDSRFGGPVKTVGAVLHEIPGYAAHEDILPLLRREGLVRGHEWHRRTPSGASRWYFEDARCFSASPGADRDPAATYVEAVVREITVRKHKESVLLADQHKYQSIVESIREGYFEMSPEGRLLFFNRAFANLLGESEEKLLGALLSERFHVSGILAEVATAQQMLIAGASDQLLLWPLQRNAARTVTVELSLDIVRHPDGGLHGWRGMIRDITDRIEAEKAYRNAAYLYDQLFEEANDIVYTHDLAGRFTGLNRAGERISGYQREEALRMTVDMIVAPEYRETARQMTRKRMAGEEVPRYEIEIQAKDGRRVPLEISAGLIMGETGLAGVQGIARDISERRRAEEQRQRLERQYQYAQKLEGLGVLAGGIAHDFNNLLVGIMGNASMAERHVDKDAPLRKYLERIAKAAQQAADLTKQMLAYSGRGTYVVRPVQLGRIVREIAEFVKTGVSKKIRFDYAVEPDLPCILGDISQMHQVFVNCITNAAEAVGDAAGVISITIHKTFLDPDVIEDLFPPAHIRSGEYVCVAVMDTGCGMTEEQKSRIFDPFFTTKFTGRGMGLAAMMGIVRSHQGHISVESEPGKGATFRLFFPVMQDIPFMRFGAAHSTEADVESLAAWRGDGLVLVADDEEAVCLLAREVLERHGFAVVITRDGREALDQFSLHRERIVLALIDLMMPLINGQEVLEQIRSACPDLPVILSSGYTEQEIENRFAEARPQLFIQKPYRAEHLVAAVKQALERASH